MFDFEKLEIYQKAKYFNKEVIKYLASKSGLNRTTKDQLQRAALSIMLNIAEGSSRFSKADRRNFYVIARGSIFECVAIFDFLKEEKLVSQELYDMYYEQGQQMSKMLFAMIKNLDTKQVGK